MHLPRSVYILAAGFVAGVVADAPLIYDVKGYNNGTYGRIPKQSYKTVNFSSPLWQINIWNKEAVDDTPYLLTALADIWVKSGDAADAGNYGPYIFSTADLSLVYADPTWPSAKQTRVQEYNNTPYLTFWGGTFIASGHGEGKCYMLNSRYETEYIISAVNAPGDVDLHECQLTADGTALITSYNSMPYDLTSVNGPANGTLIRSFFQEIDIATGQLVFEWDPLDHYPITYASTWWNSSNEKYGWDWFHLNSIQKTADGNYLISSLGLSSIGYINGTTGSLIWSLGGTPNNFTEPKNDGSTKLLTHDARFPSDDLTVLTYYDNTVMTYQVGCKANCTKGRLLKIDHEALTATLVESFYHPQSLQGGPEGSLGIMPNGNALVGWGGQPSITEYNTKNNTCVFDVQFAAFNIGPDNYRAYKANWVGEPTWNPAIASTTADGTSNVWVSWNGATEVKKWALLTAASPDADWTSAQVVQTVSKAGFETSIPVNSTTGLYARVAGLDASGAHLGSTDILEVQTGIITPAIGPILL